MNATPLTPWSQLLQRLDPMAPIGLGITAKGASINRAFDAQLQRAIWDKRYELPANDPRLAYRVFSKWENTLIAQLKDKGVLGGPRFVALEQRASPMHSGATPMKDRDTGMSLLRTHDLGPDLDVWTRMRPCIQGAPKDHLLYRASDLLRLVRAILVALKDFHDHGFVHCDLHAGNVALPCRETHRASGNGPQGESITVQPLWDELRIFDLDASLSRHSAPPVVPYLHTDPSVMPRMSNNLRLRLCMLHALAESCGHDNAYNEQFWARQTGWDLQCLQKVDWREDLHQLGHLLKGLLHTEQCAIEYDHPDQDFLLDKLVDAFMAWGAPKQLSGLTTEQLSRRPTESAHAYYLRLREWVDRVEQLGTPAKPHTQYIAEIDAMLTKHPGTGSGVWVFRREDNDLIYAAALRKPNASQGITGEKSPQSDGDAKPETIVKKVWDVVVPIVFLFIGFIVFVTVGQFVWDYAKSAMQSWGNPFQSERRGLAEATEKYLTLSKRIQAGTWFTTGKGNPSQEERDWIKQTQSLAANPGLPHAQFNLAMLYCSGVGGATLPKSTVSCGEWLSRTLAAADEHNSTAEERSAYRDSTAKVFDSLVWSAKQPDAAFARALAPGLQAAQDDRPGLANRLALVQACYQAKPDPALARSTLQRTLEKHPQADTTADTRALLGMNNLCTARA